MQLVKFNEMNRYPFGKYELEKIRNSFSQKFETFFHHARSDLNHKACSSEY